MYKRQNLNKYKYDKAIRSKKREEFNISEDTLVIGHIGRFVTQKNHVFLIEIFNELHKKNKNSKLILAGQGPLLNSIKAKVGKLSLTDSVLFLGQRLDAHELYQMFDVFLLPSLYEGLPVVGVEAQAAGLYCLFSDDMTKETRILTSTRFMSLNQSAETWANTLLNEEAVFIRKDTREEISINNFNIELEANKLERYYSQLYKENS